MDAHPPIPVRDLATLNHAGPTPAEQWVADARRRDLIMPAAAALTLVIVALAVPVVLLVAAVIQRVVTA